MGKVRAVCISEKRGTCKHPVEKIEMRRDYGIVGDGHAGNWHRQISLLPVESADRMRAMGLTLRDGAFAENIVTEGVALNTLPVGTRLRVGETLLEVTQIGKECHNDCAIKKAAGMCVMPTDGIFAIVVEEGTIRPGDEISIEEGTA